MLWCVVIIRAPSLHVKLYCMSQRNGTAVHSLASECLQELECLVGLERQKQEDVVGITMGSIYQGEALYPWIRYM
jgi:hypothetical protein